MAGKRQSAVVMRERRATLRLESTPMDRDLTDPLNSTAPEISRRGFAILGSAAIASLASATAARAQEYGKPHPPIVAEDDPGIAVLHPQLQPVSGGPIAAYAAAPRETSLSTPGIVLIHHVWGVDAQIRDVVRRLAKAGFITIAPMLYSRLNAPSGDGATDNKPFAAIAHQMVEQGHLTGDITSAHDWILTQSPNAKIGIMGFCMGGGIALLQIIGSSAYAAAVMFYGDVRPETDDDFTKRITTPLMGNFGARDTSIKAADATAMFARLSVPHDVKIYDEAGHAFFDDTRARYVPSAAEDAWPRTLAWFHEYLEGK